MSTLNTNETEVNTNVNTKDMNTMNETKFIPDFNIKYSLRKAKAVARRALWTGFLLEHSSPYILEESLNFFRYKGDKWLSLIFGDNGLDFSLEGYTPQEGEVIILPKLHISVMEYNPGEYPLDIVARLLKPVYFCTRKEADYLRTLYRAKDSQLVEVDALRGGEGLLEIDAALR